MDVVRALTICGGAARRPALAKLGAPGDVTLLVRRQLLTCVSAAPFYGLWTVDASGPLHVHHSRGEAVEHQVPHRGLKARQVLQWVDRGAGIPAGDVGPNGVSAGRDLAACRHAQPLFDLYAVRVPRN